MRHGLSDRGALLGDFGVSLGAALAGKPRRARIDAIGARRWPSAGATLDLDFVNQQGYARGLGLCAPADIVTFSGAANGTRVNRIGVIESATTPRFDFDPASYVPEGLLIEEARTNLLTYSEQFDDAAWSKGNVTISADAVVAPNGTTTADKIAENAAIADHNILQSYLSALSSTYYTLTVFLKAAERTSSVVLITDQTTGDARATFDLSGGTITSAAAVTGNWSNPSAAIESAGNGWYRVRITAQKTAIGNANATASVYLHNGSGTSYEGDITKGIYVWGAQLEAGSFASSYIPTTSAAVTRTAESGTQTFSATDLAFATEFSLNAVTGTRPILSLDDGTADNQIRLYADGASLKLTVTTGGVTQADLTLGTVAANATYKAAFSARANEFLGTLNGATVLSDTDGTMPVVTTLRHGSDQAGNYQNGHTARTRGWTRALPDSALQRMTAP